MAAALASSRTAPTAPAAPLGRAARGSSAASLPRSPRAPRAFASPSRVALARRRSRASASVVRRDRARLVASASASGSSSAAAVPEYEDGDAQSVDVTAKANTLAGAIWKFVRPHTIRGTILGTTAIVTRCLLANPELFNLALVPRALLGLVALLCGNGYIVGINQIYDVDIDLSLIHI